MQGWIMILANEKLDNALMSIYHLIDGPSKIC